MYHSWHIIFTLKSVYSYCDVKSPSVCRYTAFSQSSIKHNKYALFISLLSLSYLSTLPPRSIRKKPQVSSMMDYSNDCLMNSYQMKEISSNKPSPTVSRESKEPPSVNRDLFARKNDGEDWTGCVSHLVSTLHGHFDSKKYIARSTLSAQNSYNLGQLQL